MLIFTRKNGESFYIGDVKLTVFLLEDELTGEPIKDEIQIETNNELQVTRKIDADS